MKKLNITTTPKPKLTLEDLKRFNLTVSREKQKEGVEQPEVELIQPRSCPVRKLAIPFFSFWEICPLDIPVLRHFYPGELNLAYQTYLELLADKQS